MGQMKQIRVYILFIILAVPLFSSSVLSQEEFIPFWDDDWSFRQEVTIPIDTSGTYAKFQPIDIRLMFDKRCWSRNEKETSVRVCCWKEGRWYELESQIYNLAFEGNEFIESCCLVFLIPEFADGSERYFVYYDDAPKPCPEYDDHVLIKDEQYEYSPVPDITGMVYYYGVKQDGLYIYGIAQYFELFNRPFSQLIIKASEGMEQIDVMNADQICSFAFTYFFGPEENAESSTDEEFIQKKVFVDGNLMLEFGIISKSKKGEVRTTAIYKYYYCPLEDKKMYVRVRHEFSQDAQVKGEVNIDGRFGAMLTIKSRNSVVQRMNAGTIFPYIHFFNEEGFIEEYLMNLNPETKSREWIITYDDDADIGEEAWVAYGEGEIGKTHAVIFSSHENVVTSGKNENDGIQLKATEREYFNFLGTEVDYVSINFGRNSYEPDMGHDLQIPSDLIVEFDAEVFTSEKGGYAHVRKEAEIYQELVKHRHLAEDAEFEDEERHDLTVISHFGGTRLSYPFFANKTSVPLPVIWMELWRNDTCVSAGAAGRGVFKRAYKRFPEITAGEYIVKVFWKWGDSVKMFRGAQFVTVDKDMKVHIFCLWEQKVTAVVTDQNGGGVEGVELRLETPDGVVMSSGVTNTDGVVVVTAPFIFKNSYIAKAFYKNLEVYSSFLGKYFKAKRISFEFSIYSFIVEVVDRLGLPPGVDVTPVLLPKPLGEEKVCMFSTELQPSRFLFDHIPAGEYVIQVSYGTFTDEFDVNIPVKDELLSLMFSAVYDLSFDVRDARGDILSGWDVSYDVFRDDYKLEGVKTTSFSLPPGKYTVDVYHFGELVGTKEVFLTYDRSVEIVTSLLSLIPTIILFATVAFMGVFVVLWYLKKISILGLLKLLAIGCILIALLQPWWSLSGMNEVPAVDHEINLFMEPQVMVEKTVFEGAVSYEISAVPDIFLEFLDYVVIVCYVCCVLLGVSFLLLRIKKRRSSLLVCILSAVLLCILIGGFYFGMEILSELTIGGVQGAGMLSMVVNEYSVSLEASWGFYSGFYLICIASGLVIAAIVLEMRKKIFK